MSKEKDNSFAEMLRFVLIVLSISLSFSFKPLSTPFIKSFYYTLIIPVLICLLRHYCAIYYAISQQFLPTFCSKL